MANPEDRRRSRRDKASETDRLGDTYRIAHPVRYSAMAAVLAGAIAAPLDMLLFDHSLGHAFKVAVSSGATWFGVLVVMSFSQRVRVGDRGDAKTRKE